MYGAADWTIASSRLQTVRHQSVLMKRILPLARLTALVVFGLGLAILLLEIGLRLGGWAFLLARREAPPPITAMSNDSYRVLCLGESTTADLAVQGRKSYPAQLQRILNERAGEDRFAVINRGVPATTTDLIVAELPDLLDRQRPDLVVTMMGINDGPLSDPLFEAARSGGSLRVVKLARLLHATLTGGRADAVADDAAVPESDEVARIARRDGLPQIDVPGTTMFNLMAAGAMLYQGDLDDAETLLTPLADGGFEGDLRFATTGAIGQLTVLHYQRGDYGEGDYWHRRYRELVGARHNPKTTVNYRILQRMLSERGIPLIAVQYPGLPVEPLRRILEGGAAVFVDNEDTFLREIKSAPVSRVYRDLFGGIFGHLTPYGNRLLATSVADAILESGVIPSVSRVQRE